MDKKIAKKYWTLKRIGTYGGGALLVGFIAYQIFFSERRQTLKIEKEKILFQK